MAPQAGHVPRREFFRTLAGSATTLAVAGSRRAMAGGLPSEPSANGELRQLSEHLFVHCGTSSVGILRDGARALLIDCGDAGVVRSLRQLQVQTVDSVFFTHHHRDQSCGLAAAAPDAKICVPSGERSLFTDPGDYWNNDQNLYRVYRDFRPDHLVSAEPITVDEALQDGQQLDFGPAKIQVVATPGHTEGSVSYVVNVDGRRVIFCGDCLSGPGQLWDVYSLQKGFQRGEQRVGAYHGFMGDRWRLADSLQRLKQLRPQVLVPAHGHPISEPPAAIDLLVKRLETCYENYVSISALRHYFPALFTKYVGRPGQMPIRPGTPPPSCLKHFGTTWMLVSESGAALVMDVGSPSIVGRLKQMLAAGEIRSIDGLWVTHYHFDHTDGIPTFQQEFTCPCITDRRLAAVLTQPAAWRLPCLAPEPIRVEQPKEDGDSWQWHEFKLTSFYYPGQTLYHSALLAEAGDLKMLFIGDSHTMAGLDDYCAYNRNLLGRGVGFQYCLSLLEKLQPTHLFNCHVNDAFSFTADELRFMHEALDRRAELFGELVPWPHANYGLDASWVRAMPYLQTVPAGRELKLDVVVTNHSAQDQPSGCRLVLPRAWRSAGTDWSRGVAAAGRESLLPLTCVIPATVAPGRYVLPIDIQHGPRTLPQFAEALVQVE